MADLRAILVPSAVGDRFRLARHAPSSDLAEIVERYWSVRWDLRDQPPYEQETLPNPCVNLVVGTHRPGIHGPPRARFVAHLAGEGWVFGAKFWPASFGAVRPGQRWLGVVRSIADAFGDDGSTLDRTIRTASTDDERVAIMEAFIREHAAPLGDDARDANRIVELAQRDQTITRVSDLAARAERPVRAIERLFRAHVGLTPKWIIRRYRVQEAAARLAAGGAVDCPGLAHDLGYFDQAHFIRDFKSQVGRTPGAYARMCAQG